MYTFQLFTPLVTTKLFNHQLVLIDMSIFLLLVKNVACTTHRVVFALEKNLSCVQSTYHDASTKVTMCVCDIIINNIGVPSYQICLNRCYHPPILDVTMFIL